MEAGGKDCEEETLQTAFKKLRVDAESLPGAVSASEVSAPRAASRGGLDAGGAKAKLGPPKDNWHGCMRKTSRGASRTQRRRRSKSPILHPPKFTYCSAAAASALSTPSSGLKHQRLAAPEPLEPRPSGDGGAAPAAAGAAQKELPSSGTAGHISPLVFGSRAAYETRVAAAVQETTPTPSPGPDGGRSGDGVQSAEEGGPETSACGGADAADFRALSESPRLPCSCAWKKASGPQEETGPGAGSPCRCRALPQGWQGVEVYSFTGLRNVISECERSLPSREDALRTLGPSAAAASPPAGSPRSCSEQARAYVDDITIEDLSGYMEYYLYIPKKMSHMAEMMYT